MTLKINMAWFGNLLKFLNDSNLTRAQKGNYVFDALGAICFLALLATDNPAEYRVLCFMFFLLSGMWCHSVSAPIRRKK